MQETFVSLQRQIKKLQENRYNMSNTLDTQKFSEMIKSKRGKTGLRQLATEIGISASTLSRIEQGNLPDIDTYVKLCEWLGVSTEYFTTKQIVTNTQNDIVAHLRADRTLPPATAEALIQMIKIAYASSTNESEI